MKCVGLIACGNGLGHVRRMLLLARALIRRDYRVRLYAPESSVASFPAHSCKIEHVPVDTGTRLERMRIGAYDPRQWFGHLSGLEACDLVVSDNLPEVLEIRADTVLSGHFFWHHLLRDRSTAYAKRCRQLLVRYRPRMIASALFVTPELEDTVSLHRVGLYGKQKLSRGRDLLIACNPQSSYAPTLAEFVEHLSRGKRTQVFVEPALLPRHPPAWMKPATYCEEMYASVGAAICRPGIGTVSDSLLHGARVFACYEQDNPEMPANAVRLQQAGVGEDCTDPYEALRRCDAYMASGSAQREHVSRVACLEDAAEYTAATLLDSWS